MGGYAGKVACGKGPESFFAIFGSVFSEYIPAISSVTAAAFYEPTYFGEIADALFVIGVAGVTLYKSFEIIIKQDYASTPISVGGFDYPNITVFPLPEETMPPIFVFPTPEPEKGWTETMPHEEQQKPNVVDLPSDEHTKDDNIIADPVPEEKQPLIATVSLDSLPQNVQKSYEKYDKAGWKGNVPGQTPGTKAGKTWGNKNNQLPTVDAEGNPISYREYDVNDRIVGQNRDGERFIVGSDGSVWYTDSHYGEGTSINGLPDYVKIT